MKTDCSCLSNRLERMDLPYRRFATAAILTLCSLFSAEARAQENLLCVLVPHFKDEYWLSVAHGIEQRSAELRLSARFFEAGGYNALNTQIEQISTCAKLKQGAILIGAVSSDTSDLLAALREAAANLPIIALVNELRSDNLTARIGVDWHDMGRVLGESLAVRFPASAPPLDAVLLSGPPEAGWVAPLESGLRLGLARSSVRIVATYGADTGTAEQLRLLEMALKAHPDTALVIGSAPAIEAAMAYFTTYDDRPLLAATYISHSVARGLVGRQVLAAPFDDPIMQGRLAVDAAAAAVAGKDVPPVIGPRIIILDAETPPTEINLSPADYFPNLD
ncbi:MAG: TMAO reductase system periplasmic protein TorT [Gemmobacter sp.]|nr:TMAO reductase system periplasmic protein TorT [Gemmobacter sp.]